MRSFKRFKMRRGFAMIFVILIALAMIIPVLILAASTIPRRTAVTGEAISDRVLAVADATVDNVLMQINNFPFTFVASSSDDPNQAKALEKVEDYLVAYHLALLNGGVPILDNILDSEHVSGSLLDIENNLSTYLYKLDTQEYYVVWDSTITPDYPNGHIANVSAVGPDGAIKTGTLKNLSTGNPISGGMQGNFPTYTTDNLWVEIDTRSGYVADQWEINITSYMLSKPEITRTIKALASRGNVLANSEEVPEATQTKLGTWHTREASVESTAVYFSDFSGLYHTQVYFGKYETTTGMIRSDSGLWMGGWAEDPVFAHGTVTDQAVDDGNRHDGRFGPVQSANPIPSVNDLTWAFANEDPVSNKNYANNNAPVTNWPNCNFALIGNQGYRNQGDPDGGIQDKAYDDYYVNGDATIVFSVDSNGDGWVTINNSVTPLPMPPNGAIYVEGTATVSGTVKGRCTVGAGNNINIGGNIEYNTSPRTNMYDLPPQNADALGLVAKNNVIIPAATFTNYPHLTIDAAILAVSGYFGIDPNASWHQIDPTGTYEAWWNGCQAMWNTSRAPAMVSGTSIQGYEIQHTNYDWNLWDNGGPPPFYPLVNSTTVEHWNFKWPQVNDFDILLVLNGVGISQLIPVDSHAPDYNPNFPYKYIYEGVTYYVNLYDETTPGHWSASAQMNSTPLYRITWKEQVAQPIEP